MTRALALALALLYLAGLAVIHAAHAGDIVLTDAISNALQAGLLSGALLGYGMGMVRLCQQMRWRAVGFALILVAVLLLNRPAHAAGDAPGAHLWPPEPRYHATVIELATLGPAMFPEPRCDLDPCGDWYVQDHGTPDPAPVPLPPTLLLLTAAIAALIWKGKHHV